MTEIHRIAIVPFSAEQMYNLVSALEDYPSFIPGCQSIQVERLSETSLNATMTVVKGMIKQEFTTHNLNTPFESIEMNLKAGPFSEFKGAWRFKALGDEGCKISLDLEFDIANRLLSLAFGPVFQQLAEAMVDAFVERAQMIYGTEKCV